MTQESAAPRRRGNERTFIWHVLAAPLLFILWIGVRFDVRGAENIPKTGPFILAANHYTMFDPLIVAYSLWKAKRAPRFMAKESLFTLPVVGWALRSTGHIPVRREGGGNDSLAAAHKIVTDGAAVIIYPEGTLTRDPNLWPMRGKTGAARLALAEGIPVIPCATWGVQHVMAPYSKKVSLFPRKRVQVMIGPPLDLSAYAVGETPSAKELGEVTRVIMDDIARLQGELRGEEPPAVRWNPADHGQSETGRQSSGAAPSSAPAGDEDRGAGGPRES